MSDDYQHLPQLLQAATMTEHCATKPKTRAVTVDALINALMR